MYACIVDKFVLFATVIFSQKLFVARLFEDRMNCLTEILEKFQDELFSTE